MSIMKLKKVRIKNFRGYNKKCEISIGDLTAIVGKNDIGKSSILEALEVFFNKGKGVIKMDKDDVNKICLAVSAPPTPYQLSRFLSMRCGNRLLS